jgi:hypothetical protein
MTTAKQMQDNGTAPPAVCSRLDRTVRPLVDRLRDAAMNRVVVGYTKRALCAEAAVVLQNLREWLEGYARCPCCQKVEVCSDGCTFDEDDPSGAEHRDEVRQLLSAT